MTNGKDHYLEQLQRRRERAETPAEATTEKPIEQMSGDELEAAITQARRDLLDAQHQELRERELERVQAQGQGQRSSQGRVTLAHLLREKQHGKRKTWR